MDKNTRAALAHPLLLLEQGALKKPPKQTTQPIDEPIDPRPSSSAFGLIRASKVESLVFEVKKAGKSSNTFALGVTFGRNDHNDICIPDDSVSGLHGYFQQAPENGVWTLTDVGSTNGTRAAGFKLAANTAHLCSGREELIIGRVRMLFLLPQMFFAALDSMI